jgi:hypothetical protein
MTSLAEDIQNTFSNVLKIYEDVSSMLQDADALIQKAGYRCLHGNSIGTESSKHIGYPRWWVYPYISRYYISDENPS